jgi:hypothetical protein
MLNYEIAGRRKRRGDAFCISVFFNNLWIDVANVFFPNNISTANIICTRDLTGLQIAPRMALHIYRR